MIELSELVTENLQGVIQNATVKTIDESRDIFENIDHTTVQVALTMFPLAIIGGGGYYKTNAGLSS